MLPTCGCMLYARFVTCSILVTFSVCKSSGNFTHRREWDRERERVCKERVEQSMCTARKRLHFTSVASFLYWMKPRLFVIAIFFLLPSFFFFFFILAFSWGPFQRLRDRFLLKYEGRKERRNLLVRGPHRVLLFLSHNHLLLRFF